ncbi:MAG: hotdog fold domain-containing protein [Alteraurantiacibacter sp.]
MSGFATRISRDGELLIGPWRKPRQMLSAQSVSGNASIHDDGTAKQLGFSGGTIEGPTHFSQFEPLAEAIWGSEGGRTGCISAHYRAPVFEGEAVRAIATLSKDRPDFATIRMEKEDGTEVLTGSLSMGEDAPQSALRARLAGLDPLSKPVLEADVPVGARTSRIPVIMGHNTHMGDLYPFTLADKLAVITEPNERFGEELPFEMISVLANAKADVEPFAVRRPSVGLFADQEIRLHDGPLKVGESYEVKRVVIARTGSRKTESLWTQYRIYPAGESRPAATMLLNLATLKASYPDFEADAKAMYGDNCDA